MSLSIRDPSDFEFDDEKLESEFESDESPKWATLSLIVVFVLGIMGIHFTCIVLNYIICFYRFIMVWDQIFRINRVERQIFTAPPTAIPCVSQRTIEESLVTRMYGNLRAESDNQVDSACPICLVDFQRTDLVSHGTKCDHIFHRDCISFWLQKQQTCPCCRQDITQEPEAPAVDYCSFLYEYFKMSIVGLSSYS